MTTQNSTTATEHPALATIRANIARAETMIKTLNDYGQQRWIAQRADPDHQHHLVGQRSDKSLALFFTNDPYLFHSREAAERLVCIEPIQAIDALTWYEDFLKSCRETEKFFNRHHKAAHMKNESAYQPKDDSDELNPKYLFCTRATDLLVAIVNGQIDPVELARQELKSRGLDNAGKWVGFKHN